MKISFILPVYNVEAYLRECVESLLAQTYTVFEIVLVDDGSPDGCPALCDQLATEDNRIKVLHKPNGGLSDARNAGLNIASGDYVIFVDSDDKWIGENSLEKLIDKVIKLAVIATPARTLVWQSPSQDGDSHAGVCTGSE